MFSFHPPKKITRGNYHCANKFQLDALIPLYQDDHDTYGVLLLSGKEALFYEINHYECRLLQRQALQLLKKHKKGGQSAARFGRMADSKREHTVDYVMELFWGHFWCSETNKIKVNGLIVAGPAELKTDLINTETFQKYFKSALICAKNLNGFDDGTIYTLFAEAQADILAQKVIDERAILDKVLMLQITNPDSLAFGLKEITNKLSDGLLKQVIGVKPGPGPNLGPNLGPGPESESDFQTIKELVLASGAELILLETIEVGSRVDRDYGGWLGIQWFVY